MGKTWVIINPINSANWSYRRTRETYRDSRISSYRNYTNVLETDGAAYAKYLEDLAKEAVKPVKSSFYEFSANTKRINSSIVHFQLRNLLRATSKHDIYIMRHNCIYHWDLMSYRSTQVLNLHGGHTGSLSSNIGSVNISTLTTGAGILVVGGFSGQLVAQRLSDLEVVHESFITQSDNGITNAIEVFDNQKILTSSNDSVLRIFDMTNFKQSYSFCCDWPVNYSTASPNNSRIIVAVGDDLHGLLIDQSANRIISRLKGHEDYSFAAAWNPSNEFQLATGNQDITTRIWDIRYPEKELKILKGHMGAIRSLRYSADGQFLLMSELIDLCIYSMLDRTTKDRRR